MVRVVNTDSLSFSIIENDLTDEENDNYDLEGSLFDIVSDVSINIGPSGELIATQTVSLEARSEQTKPLIPTLEDLLKHFGDEYEDTLDINFVAVKVGSAIIDIQGVINAAAIRAIADSLVNVSAMNDNLAKFGMPLAVGVVVSEAGITARDHARLISTAGGIYLKADSDVTLATHAVSGVLPFVLAVSAVVNDAYVDIKGNTQVNSQGDTTLSAYGWTNITTSASGPKATTGTGSSGSDSTGPKTPGNSGGFFAVSVAVQNVFTAIRESASANAGGNLTLSSTARERVKNEATSNPDDGGTSFTLENLINKINSLLTKSSQKTSPSGTGSRGGSGLTAVASKLTGAGTGTTNLVNTGTAGVTGTGQAGTTSSTQLVGALAVTYAENSNMAFIDTLGTIKSQGILAVHAKSSTINETIADGSPIKRTSTGATGVANPDAGTPAQETGMTYNGRTQGNVIFETTQNGFLTIDKTENQQAGNEIIITVHANAGYKLENITAGNGVTLTKIEDDKYKFTMPEGTVTLAATFIPKAYTITSSNENATGGTFYTSPRYGDAGDSFIINVTPNDGYTVKEVLVTYTDATGAKQSHAAQPVTGQPNQYQFTMPAANVIVTVTFEGVNKKLSIDSGISNGTITVKDSASNVIVSNASGSVTENDVQVGTVLTVEVTPAEGHRLKANSLKIGNTIILPNTSGVYQFTMPGASDPKIILEVVFEPGAPATSNTGRTGSRALGVGVAVGVVNHSNQAYIKAASGSVEAGGLDITAETNNLSSSTISRSGFTPGDLGLAGALTVHVVSAKNSAELNNNLILSGGSINLRADVQNSKFVTVADAVGTSAGTETGTTPNGSPASDSVGIGAGIAIGVFGVDSYAKIADGVSISKASGGSDLDSMNVTASYNGSEEMIAKAGASGGTSIVPVLALNVSGVYVDASTGTYTAGAPLEFKGDINITAFSEITRNILADAAAVGDGVGFGGSFIVDIVNDSAAATLGRSVRGKKVLVKADSVSRINATGKAGAQGTPPKTNTGSSGGSSGGGSSGGDGSSGSGDSGSGSSGSGDSGSGDSDSDDDDPYAGIADLFKEDGEDDTPEDDDYSDAFRRLFDEGEADAVADANTQAAANLANIVGTQNVTGGAISSLTANRQKAETSEGSVQVAATFTLNIQRNVSKAIIADGIIVIAYKPAEGAEEGDGSIIVESRNDTDGVITSDASATNSTVGVGVAVAINIVTYENIAEVGDARLTGESLTIKAGIYEEEAKNLLDEIINELLQKLNIDKELVDQLITELEDKPLEEYLKGKLDELGITDADDIASLLTQTIIARLEAFLKGTDVNDSVEEELQELVNDTVTKIADGFKDAKVIAEAVKNAATAIINNIKDPQQRQEMIALSLKALAALLGSNDELDGVGHRISTQTISGVGAANVGVAGSVAISVVKGITKAIIADRSALTEGNDINITGDIIITADGAQRVYTTASSSADGKGKANKNKAATGGSTSTNNGTSKTGGTSGTTSSSKTVGVGAAFALGVADLTVHAGIGNYRKVEGASIKITAKARNDLDTVSVAGTDPIGRSNAISEGSSGSGTPAGTTTAKDISVDASVAVSLIQNDVKAYVGQGAVIKTTAAEDTIETGNSGEKVNFYLYAYQSGETNTNASGFAVGNTSSVGAAVALNIALSEVYALFAGEGDISGKAKLAAATYNEDNANALATAMGADLDRYLAKFRAFQNLKKKSSSDPSTNPPGNNTSSLISGRLNNTGSGQGTPSQSGLPVSTNALHAQNASTTSTNQASSTANNSNLTDVINQTAGGGNGTEIGSTVGNALSGGNTDASAQQSQTIHVAAAVGVNVTRHDALTSISGSLKAKNIEALTNNNGNFSTVGTGVAASLMKNSNSIGVGVAISVNQNKARVELGGKITATDGNIVADAELTQNMDGVYRGKYGALGMSGSASGAGGKAGVAGSLAVVVADGVSSVTVLNGAELKALNGDINLEATDKSKLSAAAMAAVLSNGSTVGVGAAFALLYAQNKVLVIVGDDVQVTAKSFTLNAEKQPVTIKDWNLPFELYELFTVDASGGQQGIINVTTGGDGQNKFGVTMNVKAEDLVDIAQLTSFLGSVNYYASAAAGTIIGKSSGGSESQLALAGAVSMLFQNSLTKASIGDRVVIILNSGDLDINAYSNNNARIIGGAVSVSSAKAGVGLNVAVITNNDQVIASIGKDGTITVTNGKVNVTAASDLDAWSITVWVTLTSLPQPNPDSLHQLMPVL